MPFAAKGMRNVLRYREERRTVTVTVTVTGRTFAVARLERRTDLRSAHDRWNIGFEVGGIGSSSASSGAECHRDGGLTAV